MNRWQLMAAAISVTCVQWSYERAAAQTPAPTTQPVSLCATYRGDFLIGTAVDFTTTAPLTPVERDIIKTQFNVITPENSMKPGSIHSAEDRWNWAMADTLVNFCQAYGIQTVGHCLVWHNQTPRWFFEGENGQPITREKAIERLRQHITTEVGHFKGKLKGWDVVNEAINDSGPGDTENLRASPWFTAIGPDYLGLAYKFAHEADPDVDLYYNDYNIEKGNKHLSSLLLLKRLISEGAPITAVGIQGHWALNSVPFQEIDSAISDYKAIGLKVNITELDITIAGQGGGQLTQTTTRAATAPARGRGFGRGPAVPPSPQQLEAQAKAYATLFEIFQKHKDVIGRVTFWGLNDARSWRRGQAPLLFDGDNKPKPAYFAVVDAKN